MAGGTRSYPVRGGVAGLAAVAPLVAVYVLVAVLVRPGPDPVRDEPSFLAAAERLVAHGMLAHDAPDADQRAFLWHGPGVIFGWSRSSPSTPPSRSCA